MSQPFWDALREHRILIQYSPSAGRYVFYPRTLAPGHAGRRPRVARNRRRGNAVHVHRGAPADRSAVGREAAAAAGGRRMGRRPAGQHRTGRRRARGHPHRHARGPGVLRRARRAASRCCGTGLPMFETVQQLLRSRMDDDSVAMMHGDRSWTWREHLAEAAAEASVADRNRGSGPADACGCLAW